MKFIFSPQRSEQDLSIEVRGNSVVINGVLFNFSPLPDDGILPVGSVDSVFISGDVCMENGEILIPILLPLKLDAPEEALFPQPVVQTSGAVNVPGHGNELSAAEPSIGHIDWKQLRLPVVPTFEETVATYVVALENHLDAQAQTRRYDNRITCSLRAGYPGPYQAEGIAFATWMDACNEAGYSLLAEARSGSRQLPSIKEFIQSLPELVWPT